MPHSGLRILISLAVGLSQTTRRIQSRMVGPYEAALVSAVQRGTNVVILRIVYVGAEKSLRPGSKFQAWAPTITTALDIAEVVW